jgi:hypothetical protein
VNWLLKARTAREIWGWFAIFLGAGAVQLPALGRMAMQGVDIMEFELMRTSAEASRQLAALGDVGIAAARQQLALDYAYLILYVIMLTALCAAIAGRAGTGSTVARLAPVFAGLAVVAGLCDAIENAFLLGVLSGQVDQPWPGIASTAATIKFALLGLVVLYLVIGLLTSLRRSPVPTPAGQD